MLITACTNCSSRFRVTPEQLNLRQGAVKCGSCDHVFNGFETLEQIPDEQFASFRDGTSDPGPQAGSQALDPDMPELESVAAAPRTSHENHTRMELRAAAPVDEGAGKAASRASAARELSPLPHELPAPPPRPRPSRLWGLGALLLFLSLAVLGVFEYRALLATRYPDLRPVLQSACEQVGCSVPWQNDEMAVKLEDSELLEVPGQPGQITLSTRIRNLSDRPQEFPQLQLTLTDIDGQASVRRVFAPEDYLGRPLRPGDVMPARGDTLVSVRLEARRVKPTGYELLLFYP
jgi:predicted Zn finger-like uncharacterized protein